MRNPSPGRRRSLAALLLCAAALAAACSKLAGDSTPPEVAKAIEASRRAHPEAWKRKVILLGFDSCDPDLVEDLIRAGKLRNFARMRREGAHGPLQSLTPLLSPVVWTTVATGVDPERHGILDFVTQTPEGQRPVSAKMRQADTIWELMASAGDKVGVVGWLVSWPAEPLGKGFIVTDRIGRLAYEADRFDKGDKAAPDAAWPASAAAVVQKERTTVDDLTLDDLRAFVDVTEEQYRKAYTQTYSDPDNLLGCLRLIMADAKTFRASGERLYREERPRFFASYFNAMDAISHFFMPYAAPRMPQIDEAEYMKYRSVIEANYMWHDAVLGEYMDMADENTTVLVISDHGFKNGDLRTQDSSAFAAKTGAMWHRPYGVLYAWGGGVKAGHEIVGASVYDIAPTVLAALGYPVSKEMPGDVLESMFEGGLPHEQVETWFGERRRRAVAAAAAGAVGEAEKVTPEEREEMERMAGIGYIGGAREDPASTLVNHIGRLLSQRRFKQGIEECEKALAAHDNSENPRLFSMLVRARIAYADQLHRMQAQPDRFGAEQLAKFGAEAEEQLAAAEQALARLGGGEDDREEVARLRAGVARERGDLATANQILRAVIATKPSSPAVHAELAEVLRRQMQAELDKGEKVMAGAFRRQAIDEYTAELRTEPRQFHPLTQLALLELQTPVTSESDAESQRAQIVEGARLARGHLDKALALFPDSPTALNNMAIARLRLGIDARLAGRAPEAQEHLLAGLEAAEKALTVTPDYAKGWANKAYTLWWLDRMPDARAAALEARRIAPAYRFDPKFEAALVAVGTPLPPPGAAEGAAGDGTTR